MTPSLESWKTRAINKRKGEERKTMSNKKYHISLSNWIRPQSSCHYHWVSLFLQECHHLKWTCSKTNASSRPRQPLRWAHFWSQAWRSRRRWSCKPPKRQRSRRGQTSYGIAWWGRLGLSRRWRACSLTHWYSALLIESPMGISRWGPTIQVGPKTTQNPPRRHRWRKPPSWHMTSICGPHPRFQILLQAAYPRQSAYPQCNRMLLKVDCLHWGLIMNITFGATLFVVCLRICVGSI